MDELVRSRPQPVFTRNDFIVMKPFGQAKPRFLRPPIIPVGGQPRCVDAFNNLPDVLSIARFDPARFTGRPLHFMMMVKAPGRAVHKVPKGLQAVEYEAVQTAMTYDVLTQPGFADSWARLEVMRRWVEPDMDAHPGLGGFKPVVVHIDDETKLFTAGVGNVSRNYALTSVIPTRIPKTPFSGPVTHENLASRFAEMARCLDFKIHPPGSLQVWSGATPHCSGRNRSPDAVLQTFLWLSYIDGQGEESNINMLAQRNPALFLK